MISYDATALFPSVPIKDALNHILLLLKNDNDLCKRTKLGPDDIIDLMNLCLSTSDFLYDNRHHTCEDSGPIGLSLMVRVSQIWMDHTMDTALKLARQRKITVPRHPKLYVDDCWLIMNDPPRREGLRSSSHSNVNNTDPNSTNANHSNVNSAEAFQKCLNDVHPRVQFTREEEENNSIAYLDLLIEKHDNGSLTSSIYRKPSNTNLCIKPQSCQEPKTSIASFKGELCRCHRLCSTEEAKKEAIEFTINLYVDNGHNKQHLQHIASTYTPPPSNVKKDCTSNKNKQKLSQATTEENNIKNLFDQLPFTNDDLNEDENKTYACLTYIPEIGPQIKILAKAGVNTAFKSGSKLKDILCS